MQGDRDQGQDQRHEKPARQAASPVCRITRHRDTMVGANRMFCFDLVSRYIARHGRLISIRLRSRLFCSASLVAQRGIDMTG